MSTSGGSGGPRTDGLSGWWAASNNYSSRYRWWAAHTTGSPGILLWLHGDGAYEYNNPDSTAYLAGPDGLIQVARDHNLILLVPLSPDDDGAITWWEWGTGNAVWLKELLARVRGQYDVDLERIWIAGFSGGAEHITAQLLPLQGENLGIEAGGIVAFGGGDHPAEYGRTQPTLSYRSRFPMSWVVGEDDTAANSSEGFDARAAATRGRNAYQSTGHRTELTLVPDKQHLLNGLYGSYVRAALEASAAPRVFPGGVRVQSVFVGSTRV